MGKERISLAERGRLMDNVLHDETKLASLIYRLGRDDGLKKMNICAARAIARILREDLLGEPPCQN